ncbi:hypothetical protein [Leuconostoc carnosum]|uniref:hypothetical protein n=1 Tax=Leuconostoc carnosum TaxID=1252 RepID=UPI001680EFFE|nr:hypothetical protein [Leuconostoc carnosum]
MKTQLVLGFWTAKGFTDKLNEALADLEAHSHEIIEVQYRTACVCIYCLNSL